MFSVQSVKVPVCALINATLNRSSVCVQMLVRLSACLSSDKLPLLNFWVQPLLWPLCFKWLSSLFFFFFLHKTRILSVGIAGEHHVMFSIFCLSLSTLRSLSLFISLLRLCQHSSAPSEYLQSTLWHFFIRVMKGRGGGKADEYSEGVRWRGNEILCRGSDTDREHWAMNKGIRLGAAAGEHWFESCFLGFSFFSVAICVTVGVGFSFFFFFCRVPATLHFNSTLIMCFSSAPAAPHEICKEEHLLSMTWKRASAGETVYNKCPTNATGQSCDTVYTGKQCVLFGWCHRKIHRFYCSIAFWQFSGASLLVDIVS